MLQENKPITVGDLIKPKEDDAEIVGGELVETEEEFSRPPTANEMTIVASRVLKGLMSGRMSATAAGSAARVLDAVKGFQANKLRAATFMAKPLHKDLLHELSVKLVK